MSAVLLLLLSILTDTIHSRTCTVRSPQSPNAPSNIGKPQSFTDRKTWGATAMTSCPSPFNDVKYITIHHTAGVQVTDKTKGIETVKRIQRMHKNDRGWSDIGYHFLIDSGGNVYQGRPFYDDPDLPNLSPTKKNYATHNWKNGRPRFISGAHVGNHNANNVGISVMGCYANKAAGCSRPNIINRGDKTYKLLIELIAYLAKYLSLNPLDGNTIRTHKSWGSGTACPGNIDNLITNIRQDVATAIAAGSGTGNTGGNTGGNGKGSGLLGRLGGFFKGIKKGIGGIVGGITGKPRNGNGGGSGTPDRSEDCGRFQSINLKAVTDEDRVPGHPEFTDVQDMNTCLFKVNDPPNHGPNTKLSPHFKIKEFTSKDGADHFRLSTSLIQCLEIIRNAIGPIAINSGYRTVPHNAKEGGKSNSYHLSGTAADIRDYYNKISPLKLADIAICRCRPIFKEKGYEIGLGLATTYFHVDMRKQYGSWVYSGAPYDSNGWNKYIHEAAGRCGSNGGGGGGGNGGVGNNECPNPMYICPVVKGCYVTSKFNPNRLHPIHKTVRPHRGVDLRAREGDEIRSVADGNIVDEGVSLTKGYGLYWTILHDDGTQTKYAHLSKKTEGLKKGSRVKRGEVIGLSGTTGTSTAAHLHFEYWPKSVSKTGGNQKDAMNCIATTGPGTGVYPNGTPFTL